jgi:DNA-binding NtrC family response regulator
MDTGPRASSIKMLEMHGLTLLQEVGWVSPETLALLMAAFGSTDSSVQAMNASAYDMD